MPRPAARRPAADYTESCLQFVAGYALNRSRDDRQSDSDRNRWADTADQLAEELERVRARPRKEARSD